MSDLSDLLTVALLIWATWAIRSKSLICLEPILVAPSNITTSKQLQEAHYVYNYVRRGGTIPPLAPVYSGPYRVLHAGPKVFILEVGATHESVSVHRLTPHTGPLPVIPAHPAKRGRPKKEIQPHSIDFYCSWFCLFILVSTSSWGDPCRGPVYILCISRNPCNWCKKCPNVWTKYIQSNPELRLVYISTVYN